MPLHKDDPRSIGGYKLVDRLGAGGMGMVDSGLLPTVWFNKGALVLATSDGTLFTLDPAHPERKPVPG
ncbi:hypothetical protein [Streptomyces broussonetiae]|uniref:Uncharacterized protein n=1 Tax=Streptomyces broussonetiae TaxID=2686304 RepID=A0A6I6MZI3_9ACTN|nr:hypothetical protein [Streptomyces broussonetiae]QHA02467.1 hypothetical protein GQF42_03425 [Streptomyces broussonetiae]